MVANAQLKTIQLRSREDVYLKASIDTQEELIKSIQSMIAETQKEVDRLTVVAKRSGVVISPPTREPQKENDGRLPGWTGSPLDRENIGALLTPGDVICEIGNDQDFEAVLIIDQGDVQLVREGQEVDMKLDSRRLDTFEGIIDEKSNEPLDAASLGMSSQTGGDLQTEIDPTTGHDHAKKCLLSGTCAAGHRRYTAQSGLPGISKNSCCSDVTGEQALARDRKNIQF